MINLSVAASLQLLSRLVSNQLTAFQMLFRLRLRSEIAMSWNYHERIETDHISSCFALTSVLLAAHEMRNATRPIAALG